MRKRHNPAYDAAIIPTDMEQLRRDPKYWIRERIRERGPTLSGADQWVLSKIRDQEVLTGIDELYATERLALLGYIIWEGNRWNLRPARAT